MLFIISKARSNVVHILTIAVDFMHILWWDTNDAALLDDFRVLPYDRLYNLEIFHGNLFVVRIAQIGNACKHNLPEVEHHLSVPNL
jgi:hypothetical protein